MGQPLSKSPYSSTEPFENYNPSGQAFAPRPIEDSQANMYFSPRPSNYPPGPTDYPQDPNPSSGYPSRYQDAGQSGQMARFRPTDSGFMDDFLSGPMDSQFMDYPPQQTQQLQQPQQLQQRAAPQRRMGYQSSGQGQGGPPQGRSNRMYDGFWDDDPIFLPDSQAGGFGGDVLNAMRQRAAPAQPAQGYRPRGPSAGPPRSNVATTSYVNEPRGFAPPAGAYVTQGAPAAQYVQLAAPTPQQTSQPQQQQQQQPTIIYYDPKTGALVGNTGAPQQQMVAPQVLQNLTPQQAYPGMTSQQQYPGMTSQPQYPGLNLTVAPQQQPQVYSYNPMQQSSYPGAGRVPSNPYQQPVMYSRPLY